ncbi:MAG: creatininase family protein [Thiotrichales bacterium]|nr:MAG: creatininase family protein [Thiotrichales bacterium]
MKTPGAFAAHLSWPELERRVEAAAVAVLPIAAACKVHGPHLPMQADLLQADWLAGVLVQRANVLVWPTVSYGYYPAFTAYPGSVSLSRETFQCMVQEILSDIQRTGVRTGLILNTGISTIEPLQDIVDELSKSWHITLANVYDGPCYRREAEVIAEQPCGGHADELETSIILAIDRRYVLLDKAVVWTPPTMAASGPFSRDQHNPRYSPAGIWGDPTLASEEKGRQLLSAMVDDLLALLH